MSTSICELREPRGWRWNSDLAVYTERFINGRLLAASLQGNGVPVATPDEHRISAFELILDGEDMSFDWDYVSFDIDGDTSTLLLRHRRKSVELEVRTAASDFGCFKRMLVLHNKGKGDLTLTRVMPLMLDAWHWDDFINTPQSRDLDKEGSFAEVGFFRDATWGNEGNFGWNAIPANGNLEFNSQIGRSGFRSPFFMLRNAILGGYFIISLEWPCNWRFMARSQWQFSWNGPGSHRNISCSIGPDAPAPMRVVAPGEKLTLPAVHFAINLESFDAAIQNWHRYLRSKVLRCNGGKSYPVIFNNWGYMKHDTTEAKLLDEIETAHACGAELFMVDAGWFGNLERNWAPTTGDWQTGNRLPRDLYPVFERARKLGLKCGLWAEIESAGKESKLAQNHPDWFIERYGERVERVLDLSNPEVAEYIENNIISMVERYKLDMFRLDYNLDQFEGGFHKVGSYMENTLWRHAEVITSIIDRICQRFPHLMWENCASGGARNDLAMVSRSTNTWISDWNRMPKSLRILNGMSIMYPPEIIVRLYGMGMSGYFGSAESFMQMACLSYLTISGVTPELASANQQHLKLLQGYVKLYREFIRPLMTNALVWHHTPVIPGSIGHGYAALEYSTPDRLQAVAGIFRLADSPDSKMEPSYHFRFRSLKPNVCYQISEINKPARECMGEYLVNTGVHIELDTPLTSRLLIVNAKGQ